MVALLLACVAAGVSAQSQYREPQELLRLVQEQSEPCVLVDVRTPEEFAAGHIPTAANIPVDVIAEQPPTSDRNALIIVYCRSGRRSAAAKAALDGLGYLRVVDFGGIGRWPGDLVK